MSGALFAVPFSAIAVTAAQDCFEIVAGSTKPLWLISVHLGQYSDFGDAQAELLSVLIQRAYTTTGSGGASVTPQPILDGGDACDATAFRNNTTVATGGTAETVFSGAWNVQAPFYYEPAYDPRGFFDARPSLSPGERMVVRITAPADSITMNGTLVFQEGR